MTMRDIVSPQLAGDPRVASTTPMLRRVFAHEMYEVFVGLYPGGLLTTLVYYRREALRIMGKLDDLQGNSRREDWVEQAVQLLRSKGFGPFHLIRDSKLGCQVQLTLHDRAALKIANVEVPRSAGRYKDMFLDPL